MPKRLRGRRRAQICNVMGVAVTLFEDMMSDDQCIPDLIEIASDSYQLQTAQHVAAKSY